MIKTRIKKFISKWATEKLACSSAAAGFSLIEVIVSISILTIGLAIAVPATIDSNRVYTRSDSISLFMSDVSRAQNRAISKGCRIIFTITDTSYSYGCDYLPYKTENFVPDTVADYATCGDVGNDDCKVFTTNLHEFIEIEPAGLSDDIFFFNSKGLLVDEDGNLTTEAVSLKMVDRDDTELFVKFADLNILTTGIVTYTMTLG